MVMLLLEGEGCNGIGSVGNLNQRRFRHNTKMSTKIETDDCLEWLKRVEDKSVNLVIIDPPYNIKKDSWDDIKDYEGWMQEVILELQRVLKDNGSFYMFHSEMEVVSDFMRFFREKTNFIFKQFIVWNKRFEESKNKGFLDGYVVVDMLRNYQQMAEYILYYTFQGDYENNKLHLVAVNKIKVYVKDLIYKYGGNVTRANEFYCKWSGKVGNYRGLFFGETQPILYTKQQYKGLSEYLKSIGCDEELKNYGEILEMYDNKSYQDLRYTFNNQKTHHSVWNYNLVSKKDNHITPKPIELIKNIILHSSNEGDLVLDCFLGTGTTALACKELNRNFIGCDNNQDYIKKIKEKLSQNTLKSGNTEREDK